MPVDNASYDILTCVAALSTGHIESNLLPVSQPFRENCHSHSLKQTSPKITLQPAPSRTNLSFYV